MWIYVENMVSCIYTYKLYTFINIYLQFQSILNKKLSIYIYNFNNFNRHWIKESQNGEHLGKNTFVWKLALISLYKVGCYDLINGKMFKILK